MKIPEKIQGRHKIRDAHICLLWDKYEMTVQEIAELKKFTERYIYKILSRNRMFISIDKDWEKKKRIHLLKVAVRKAPATKKDVMDLIEQLRKEIEGNNPIIDLSQHQHYTKVDINVEEFNRKSTKEKIDTVLGRV